MQTTYDFDRVRQQTQANLLAERNALDDQMRLAQQRANAELAAARDKMNAEQAEHDRLQGLVDMARADRCPVFQAFADSTVDEDLTDNEIIYLLVQEYSMTVRDVIERLAAIDFAAARAGLELAA